MIFAHRFVSRAVVSVRIMKADLPSISAAIERDTMLQAQPLRGPASYKMPI